MALRYGIAIIRNSKHLCQFYLGVHATEYRMARAASRCYRDCSQTGSGASFIRSMLKRLLTLRSGTAAISLR